MKKNFWEKMGIYSKSIRKNRINMIDFEKIKDIIKRIGKDRIIDVHVWYNEDKPNEIIFPINFDKSEIKLLGKDFLRKKWENEIKMILDMTQTRRDTSKIDVKVIIYDENTLKI